MADDVFRIVGTTVAGAFKVEAVVAEGGFAVVYRAYHAGFRALVALKCLKIPQYLSAEDQKRFEQQFQAEAELLFKLSASIPTVVRPLHVEAIVAPDGSFMPFLALEWLEGETLDAISMRRRAAGEPPFSLEELTLLLDPVARALERAHNFAGPTGPISIVHRDMKPENVFLAEVAGESVVKILDFGIGKAKSVAGQVAGRASQEDGGVTSFTPAYGAPEQWSPKRYGQTGPWTDVWGLALTMVELLAGRAIIDGDQAAMMGTVLDPVRRPSPRVEGVAVGDAVEAVFQRALAVDPRSRFRHAGEFWNALLAASSADAQRQVGWSGAPGASPRTGRSGARAIDLPRSGGLGRHNLIPDLVDPAGSAALDLELDDHARRAPRQGGGSGEWPASAAVSDRAAPTSAPSVRPSATSGQWPAAAQIATGPRHGSGPPATPGHPSAAPVAPAPEEASLEWPAPARIELSEPPPPLAGARSFRPAVPVTPFRGSLPAEPRDVLRRYLLPALLLAVGIGTTLVDGAYAASRGEVFTLGPVRLGWIAASLVIGGIALAAARFFADGS